MREFLRAQPFEGKLGSSARQLSICALGNGINDLIHVEDRTMERECLVLEQVIDRGRQRVLAENLKVELRRRHRRFFIGVEAVEIDAEEKMLHRRNYIVR